MTTLFAYLSYHDAQTAIAWLEAIMLATADARYAVPPLIGRSTGNGLYLRVDDVAAIYAAAIDAGATSILQPETTEWGSERARVLDPEGHEWSFGSYEPGGSR